AAGLEAGPGGTVGEHVGPHTDARVDSGPHATTGLAIPAPGRGLGVDARLFPEPQLGLVGSAVVAARDERGLGIGDSAKGGHNVLRAGNARGVLGRADDDEVVVHDVEALHAPAVGDELLLGGLVVHEQHVAVPV